MLSIISGGGGGGGGGGSVSGNGVAGSSPPLPNLFRSLQMPSSSSVELLHKLQTQTEEEEEQQQEQQQQEEIIRSSGGGVSVVCPCAAAVTAQSVIAAGLSPLWCAAVGGAIDRFAEPKM